MRKLYRVALTVVPILGLLMHQSFAQAASRNAPWVGVSFDGKPCNGNEMNYGPFDYSNSEHRTQKLPIVEHYHFTDEVRALRRGKSGSIIGDINYTLTAFPNHIKALESLVNYEKILRVDKVKNSLETPVECYFMRAINFAPDDAVVIAYYAIYLKDNQKYEQAEKFYNSAIKLAPDKMAIRNSFGIFLAKQRKYNQALEQAKVIYEAGFPQQKLKQLLIEAKAWDLHDNK